MVGERLFELMNSKGGNPSDYADIVYGVVIQASPLKIQLSNQLIITDDFIVMGKHIGKFKLQGKAKFKGSADMTFHGHHDTADIKSIELNFPKDKFEIEFDNSLEKDDKVTLIRMDGGQQYYLFERVDKDGSGF